MAGRMVIFCGKAVIEMGNDHNFQEGDEVVYINEDTTWDKCIGERATITEVGRSHYTWDETIALEFLDDLYDFAKNRFWVKPSSIRKVSDMVPEDERVINVEGSQRLIEAIQQEAFDRGWIWGSQYEKDLDRDELEVKPHKSVQFCLRQPEDDDFRGHIGRLIYYRAGSIDYKLPEHWDYVIEFLERDFQQKEPITIGGYEVQIDPQEGIEVGCYSADKDYVCELALLAKILRIERVDIAYARAHVTVERDTLEELRSRLTTDSRRKDDS